MEEYECSDDNKYCVVAINIPSISVGSIREYGERTRKSIIVGVVNTPIKTVFNFQIPSGWTIAVNHSIPQNDVTWVETMLGRLGVDDCDVFDRTIILRLGDLMSKEDLNSHVSW